MPEICSFLKSLPLVVGLFIVTGCATVPPVEVKSEVPDPSKVKEKTVAVMRDFYMEDVGEADHVVAEVREALKRQGFIVKKSELDAELVVVPTLARSADAYTPAPVREINRPVITATSSQVGMMHDSVFGSDLSDMDSAGFQPTPKVGLMISAITKEDWQKAATTDQESPRVWRVTAITYSPRDAKTDVVATLLTAVEPKLAQIRSGVAPDATSPAR
jgi:hypothetical protein